LKPLPAWRIKEDAKYFVGYETERWTQSAGGHKATKWIFKWCGSDKAKATEVCKQCNTSTGAFEPMRHEVITNKKYKEILASLKEQSSAARKATLKKNADKPKKKPTFILCPHCQATSKLLSSEMGGYQTRRCKDGHEFNYDKWIGDRLLSVAIFGAGPVAAAKFAIEHPVR
jgi:hypothetical protein